MKPNIAFHELWMYFWRNHQDFVESESEALIAKNDKTGVLLCMGKSGCYPELRVYLNENVPHVIRIAHSKDECTSIAARLYTHWLSDDAETARPEIKSSKTDAESENPNILDEDEEDPQEPDLTPDELIYERETELHDAMGDLLATILCLDDGVAVKVEHGDKLVEECVDWFMEYLADIHGLNVYRPTYVENNDNGTTEFVEFPYGEDA